MNVERDRPIPWDIYQEHLDEATFIWSQWERSLAGANYTVREVAMGPEERLLAHLDALLIGGTPVAERFLLPALEDDDPSRVSVAGWVLLQSEGTERLEAAWGALLGAKDPRRRQALGRAFELSLRADLPARLLERLGHHDADVDAVIVDVVAAQDRDRLARLRLHELGAQASGELLGAVLRAIQRVPDAAYRPLIERGLSSDNPGTRVAAIEAGTLLQVPSTRAACRQVVAEWAPYRRLAMSALAVIGDGVDFQRLLDWSTTADLAPDALWALAFTGRIDCAERLLGVLDDAKLGPLAADSFGSITGLTIDGPFARTSAPASLDEVMDDDGPIPELSADDDLVVPNAESVRGWWRVHGSRLDPNVRHVYGQPWSGASVRAALVNAPTWRRPGLRLGLTALAACAIDLRTWARRQMQ